MTGMRVGLPSRAVAHRGVDPSLRKVPTLLWNSSHLFPTIAPESESLPLPNSINPMAWPSPTSSDRYRCCTAGLGLPARKRVRLPPPFIEDCWPCWDVCASRPVRVSIPASTSSLRRVATACYPRIVCERSFKAKAMQSKSVVVTATQRGLTVTLRLYACLALGLGAGECR